MRSTAAFEAASLIAADPKHARWLAEERLRSAINEFNQEDVGHWRAVVDEVSLQIDQQSTFVLCA